MKTQDERLGSLIRTIRETAELPLMNDMVAYEYGMSVKEQWEYNAKLVWARELVKEYDA